ncbi:MAG: hypothetical protein MUF81_03980 [Verrucomicrobia bacterium]|jgi:hypothetical protein|nr:hypothetical protein [Verrucomicrobiota bacterium]
MNAKDEIVFFVPLWPCRAAVLFILRPCLGVSLLLGETAFTLAVVVSDLNLGCGNNSPVAPAQPLP